MPHPLDNSNTDESKRRMTTQPALRLPVEVKTVRRDTIYSSNILYSSDILTKPVTLTLYPGNVTSNGDIIIFLKIA